MRIYVVGSLNMDLVINTDVMPDNGVTVTGYGFMANTGGKGANQAVAVARCGGSAAMIGSVGKEFGKELVEALKGYGVDVSYVERETDISSGIAVVLVNGGDNRIILDTGANARTSAERIKKGLAAAEKGDYLITQSEIPSESVLAALTEARRIGMTTVYNPAPARELPDEIFALTDYFVPNQSETLFYTGIYPDDVASASDAAKILMDKGVKNVVITMGAQGSVAFTADSAVTAKAMKVIPTDTTAAGDTFVGAMTVMLSEGAALAKALTFANAAAGIAVTRKGAQQSIPNRGETEQCVRK